MALSTAQVRKHTCPNCKAVPGTKCTYVISADSPFAKNNGKIMLTGACAERWAVAEKAGA